MLQVDSIIIYIIYEISVLLKITRILKHFLRSIIDFSFLKKKKNSQHIMMKFSWLEEEDKNIEENTRYN